MKKRWGVAWVAMLAVALVVAAPVAQVAQGQAAQEPVDYDAIHRIKDEGLSRSQVMDIMSWLTDVHGPRLTGSPTYKKAADWSMEKMKSWGLVNVRTEPWRVTPRGGPQQQGPQPTEFGRGWSNEKFYMQVTAPVPFPVIGFPKAWTASTSGLVSGEAVLAVMTTEADFAKYKGTLKGKFVLTTAMRAVPESTKALSIRNDEKSLAELAMETIPTGPGRAGAAGRFGGRQRFNEQLQRFLAAEGVAVWVDTSSIADGGTIFASGGGSRGASPNDPPNVPRVAIAIEHYGRIVRLIEKKIPVKIEADIQNTFHEKPELTNIFGEIAGTDKADELVMLGAHFDSWHGGTGATDNAAGSAVMMEAMRILKASGVKLRRTVRIGLWGGEEQGLLGSRYYARQQFAEPAGATWTIKPAHAKFAGYFNVDNGTGKIRGVYLQGNEAVAPIFRAWMEPFHNMGMTTLTPRDTGGTDHLSFDGVGLPGFQFIQDDVEYDTRTHHSNMDTYERIQEADMKQMAVIVASFVYHAANRPQLLPRKPMPAPAGGGRGGN